MEKVLKTYWPYYGNLAISLSLSLAYLVPCLLSSQLYGLFYLLGGLWLLFVLPILALAQLGYLLFCLAKHWGPYRHHILGLLLLAIPYLLFMIGMSKLCYVTA